MKYWLRVSAEAIFFGIVVSLVMFTLLSEGGLLFRVG